MATARANFGVCVYENKIYAIGGTTEPGAAVRCQGGSDKIKVTGVNEVYDPATNTWENKTSMLTPRADASTSIVNGKIYVIGGYGTDLKDTGITEVYDPANGSWTIQAAAPFAFGRFASAVVGSSIYLFGSTQSYNELMQTKWTTYTLVYNVENNTWSYAKPSPIVLADPGVGQTTGTFAPKAIYVISYNNITQRYNPESDTWSICAEMPLYSDDFGTTVLDDLIYVVGGGSAVFPMLYINNQNEQYTPFEYGTKNLTSQSPTLSPPLTESPTPMPTPTPSFSSFPNSTPTPTQPVLDSKEPALWPWVILVAVVGVLIALGLTLSKKAQRKKPSPKRYL